MQQGKESTLTAVLAGEELSVSLPLVKYMLKEYGLRDSMACPLPSILFDGNKSPYKKPSNPTCIAVSMYGYVTLI